MNITIKAQTIDSGHSFCWYCCYCLCSCCFFFAFDGCYCDNLFVLLPFEWHCPIASLLFAIFPLYHITYFVQHILLVHASLHIEHTARPIRNINDNGGAESCDNDVCGCVVMLCCLFVLSKSLVFNVCICYCCHHT